VAVLAPALGGPLGEHVAYVWVDQPTAATVIVEVRVGDHPVARREIAVRGLAGDVAARLVAIAASEMVRAGMVPRPLPAPPPPAPRRPTADEIERASRVAPALLFTASADVAGLPAVAGVMGGPSLAIGFRLFGVTETLFGRWLTGTSRGGGLRWLEVGLAADYRVWLGRSWRLVLGGAMGFSSLHVADAATLEGQADQRETWSARAGGRLGIERRLDAPVWLALVAEPGAMLRPVHYRDVAGKGGAIEGAFLALGLAVTYERVRAPEPPAAP
jgi:hypothetical protein